MQLFLSNEAYQSLAARARITGYIRRTMNRGLNMYMSDLLNINPRVEDWRDTRPENIKAQDVPGLEAGQLPMWTDGSPRYVRVLVISPTREVALAKALGMGKYHPFRKAPSFQESSLMSEFWESVGIGWLSPTNEAATPKYKTDHYFPSQKQQFIEFQWNQNLVVLWDTAEGNTTRLQVLSW